MPKPLEYVDFEISMPRILVYILGLAVIVGGVFAYAWVTRTTNALDSAREFRFETLSRAWSIMCNESNFERVAEPEVEDVIDTPYGLETVYTDPQSRYYDAYRVFILEVHPRFFLDSDSDFEMFYENEELITAKLTADTEAEFETVSEELDAFCSENYRVFTDALYDYVY